MPWRSRRDAELPDAEVVHALVKDGAGDLIAIADEESEGGVRAKRVDDLLRCPLRIWVRCDVDVEDSSSLEREALLYFDGWHLQCARWKNWKLHVARYTSAVYSAAPQGGRQNLPLRPVELYNLELDPDESYDVAAGNPAIVAEISGRIERLLKTFPEPVLKAWAETQAKATDPSPAGQWPRPKAPGA